MYREILSYADELGGKLNNRVIFYCDEWGTLPKIESAEMMFSASRSRRMSIVPIIQSFAQLEKNYGKEGAEIIIDNTQLTVFGGFAPNSETAQMLSKSLGSQTVMSGSVSKGKESSESLQMIERPLMTPDELKSMPKGQFIVTKTGTYPMKVQLKLFFEWGIQFIGEYKTEEKAGRKVAYASREKLIENVKKTFEKAPEEPAEAVTAAAAVTHTAPPKDHSTDKPQKARSEDKAVRVKKFSNGGTFYYLTDTGTQSDSGTQSDTGTQSQQQKPQKDIRIESDAASDVSESTHKNPIPNPIPKPQEALPTGDLSEIVKDAAPGQETAAEKKDGDGK